jgi:Piwi domain
LQAHAGLQGTVKATHYTVVYDENTLSADDIQQGTHDASYLYARATKAVSLIPAAYYADLACERGRCYLNDFLVDDKTSTAGSTKGDRKDEEVKVFSAAKRAWGEGVSIFFSSFGGGSLTYHLLASPRYEGHDVLYLMRNDKQCQIIFVTKKMYV